MQKPSIAIIGGSIAGCAMGIALSQLGFLVDIYERSNDNLNDRGAGICIPSPLHTQLIAENFLNQHTQHIHLTERQFLTTTDNQKSRCIWDAPFDARAYNWQTLFSQLRQRIDDTHYHSGKSVIAIENTEKHVTLTLSNHQTIEADWVIACDGSTSNTHASIYPNSQPQYAGYIAWRGLIPREQIHEQSLFEPLTYAFYLDGHALSYYIPRQTQTQSLNWLVYQKITEDAVPASLKPLVDTSERHRLTDAERKQLIDITCHLPKPLAQAIAQTPQPFLQMIVDQPVKQCRQGRILLSGDAAGTTRPHTGGGASKALQSALTLKQAIQTQASFSDAITVWANTQIQQETMLHTLGQRLGEWLVMHMPNWSTLMPGQIDQMWDDIMNGKDWYIR